MAEYHACVPCKTLFPPTEVNCYGCGEKLSTVVTKDLVPPTDEEIDLMEIDWYRKGGNNGENTSA